MKLHKIFLLSMLSLCFFCSCNSSASSKENDNKLLETQNQLKTILTTQELNAQQRYTIINQMANNLLATKDYQGVILFLTDWVEENPDDIYNSYWLLMTAYAYLSTVFLFIL